MDIITIDFETFYTLPYRLKTYTTENYIRCDAFEVIGVSVQVNDGEPVWFSGTAKDTEKFLKAYDWENSIGLAHNAMFDMAILGWRFNIHPKRIADTLGIARAIHGVEVGGSLGALAAHYGVGIKGTEVLNAVGMRRLDFTPEQLHRYGEYCKNDTALTYRLFLAMVPEFPVIELRLIDLTLRMFTQPVITLGVPGLTAHLDEVRARKLAFTESAGVTRKDLMSNDKLAELLRALGVVPPTKISATTGKEAFAFAKTDEEFKALLEHDNDIVQALVAARLGVKSTLEETRTQRFIDIAARGALPIPLRYYAAHTGRWGGDDKVNIQNLPRVSPLKMALLAPAGHVLIDSDSSQIEARTLAWLAEQSDLVAAFDRGEDVYKIMASAIYGKAVDEISKGERFVGKTTVLGCGYGMGAAKFQAQLKTFGVELPQEECERIISVYRSTYPRIPMLWKQAGSALRAIQGGNTAPLGKHGVLVVEGQKGIRLPNGLHLKYPNLRITPGEKGQQFVYDTRKGKAVIPNRIYGGKVVENCCQALARIIIGEQMLAIAKRYKVVMTVHDAICCAVPVGEAEEGQKFIEASMRMRPTWALELPLNCESGVGNSYGEC